MKDEYYLKRGNHKLAETIGIWTLPKTTCIGKGVCSSYCYDNGWGKYYKVRNYRRRKLYACNKDNFIDNIVNEIGYRNFNKVRIHEIGDFFNQEYLDKWKAIAKKCPKVVFTAYTKSFNLDLYKGLPSNFIIIQSYGSKWDDKIDPKKNTARVVMDKETLSYNEFMCKYGQSTFKKCGLSCNYCYTLKGTKHVVFMNHRRMKKK